MSCCRARAVIRNQHAIQAINNHSPLKEMNLQGSDEVRSGQVVGEEGERDGAKINADKNITLISWFLIEKKLNVLKSVI